MFEDLVTICTTSFIRKRSIDNLLKSIENSDFNGKIILMDQNEKPFDYDEYDLNIIVEHKPDCGFGVAHNETAKMVETPFLLWLDDDVLYNDKALVVLILDILSNEKLGWVSSDIVNIPKLSNYNPGCNLELVDNILYRKLLHKKGLTLCEQPSSATSLWRKEIYDDIQWDDYLKTGFLHEIVSLEIKKTDWLCAIDNRSLFVHMLKRNIEYKEKRERFKEKKYRDYVFKKYGIKGIKFGPRKEKPTKKLKNITKNIITDNFSREDMNKIGNILEIDSPKKYDSKDNLAQSIIDSIENINYDFNIKIDRMFL